MFGRFFLNKESEYSSEETGKNVFIFLFIVLPGLVILIQDGASILRGMACWVPILAILAGVFKFGLALEDRFSGSGVFYVVGVCLIAGTLFSAVSSENKLNQTKPSKTINAQIAKNDYPAPAKIIASRETVAEKQTKNRFLVNPSDIAANAKMSSALSMPEKSPTGIAKLSSEYKYSKFDYQIAQTQLKSIGLYLGTVDGKWGPRSQKALENLKELLMAQNEEWNYDDKTLIFILVKVGEEQMTDSEAVEAESSSFNIEHAAFPKPNNSSGKANLYDTPSMPAYGFNGIERVSGYFRSNGTYVEPYHRTRANSTEADNWSTKGNLNPFTGKRGSKR